MVGTKDEQEAQFLNLNTLRPLIKLYIPHAKHLSKVLGVTSKRISTMTGKFSFLL